ncbi:unnamed protein product [Rodentolepis nana]|uniref:Secreted protein n=1 Tax=Rodentolepis nana TaxID=102285 RepID=A0A0R3T9C7_RODNA|nr:unnamed protein product [Rodentolepis nana]
MTVVPYVTAILLVSLSSIFVFVEGRTPSTGMESTCAELNQKIDILFEYLAGGFSEERAGGLDEPMYVSRRRFTRPFG